MFPAFYQTVGSINMAVTSMKFSVTSLFTGVQ